MLKMLTWSTSRSRITLMRQVCGLNPNYRGSTLHMSLHSPILFSSFYLLLLFQMSRVDPDGALKIYSQNGQWAKCLALAGQQGPDVQSKYVALYAAQLIREDLAFEALQLFVKYGCPAKPQNFNIYKHLCAEVYKQNLDGVKGYPTFSCLRDILLSVVDEMSKSPEADGPNHKEFKQHLLVTHYLATRAAFQGVEQLDQLVAKLSVSLLRHINCVLADKAFFEAGTFCREVGWESMAFIFFNRFLDLSEVMDGCYGQSHYVCSIQVCTSLCVYMIAGD